MTWDQWLGVASSITGLLTFTASAYTYLWSRKVQAASSHDVPITGYTVSDPDRVVLKYAAKNAEIAGTLEYVAEQFKDETPEKYKHLIVFEPLGTLKYARTELIAGYAGALFIGATLLVLFGAWLIGGAGLAGESFQEMLAGATVMSIAVLVISAIGVGSLLSARNARKAMDIAEAYLRYLKGRDIDLGYYFTQGKQTNEKELSSIKPRAA
jgi:hypothetical protein